MWTVYTWPNRTLTVTICPTGQLQSHVQHLATFKPTGCFMAGDEHGNLVTGYLEYLGDPKREKWLLEATANK